MPHRMVLQEASWQVHSLNSMFQTFVLKLSNMNPIALIPMILCIQTGNRRNNKRARANPGISERRIWEHWPVLQGLLHPYSPHIPGPSECTTRVGRDFLKSLKQVKIFPPPSVPLHVQLRIPSPNLTSLSPVAAVVPSSCHVEPGLARDRCSSRWVLFSFPGLPGNSSWGGPGREEGPACCFSFLTQSGEWAGVVLELLLPWPGSARQQ